MRAEIEKFHPLSYKGNLTQASFDMFEEIEETLYNKDLKEDNIIRNIRYKISTMLEICDPTLDDYEWMRGLLEIVDKDTKYLFYNL